jgi:nucleoid-associated protein YgaU
MPNDAKLGLIVGVAVVITISVVFFRKDSGAAEALGPEAAAASAPNPTPPAAVAGQDAQSTAQPTNTETVPALVRPTSRRHTVKEGDTLVSLAQKYYGNKDKSTAILQANRERLATSEQLAPGTDLVIPVVKEP